jgi:hypothetical protein
MFFCWIFLFRSYVTQICSAKFDFVCENLGTPKSIEENKMVSYLYKTKEKN